MTVSPTVRPAQIRVYRYRVPQLTGGVDPNLGGIPACGFQGPAGKTFGPVPWQLLVLGADYYTDPSGLWIALSQKVDLRSDYIAVSYVTEAGVTVGSFPGAAEARCRDHVCLGRYASHDRRAAGGQRPAVVLARDAAVLPGGGPGPRPRVAEGRYRAQPFGATAPAVDILHLSRRDSVSSVPTDQNTFDRENRLFPRPRDPGADLVIRESYLAFPEHQAVRQPGGARDRPSWPIRSTRRRCTCCSRRVRRPSTSSGCDTTPPGPGIDPPST